MLLFELEKVSILNSQQITGLYNKCMHHFVIIKKQIKTKV